MIADQRAQQTRDRHTNFADFAQAGVEGLLKAIDRYNPSYGTRITTYAYYWIYAYVQKEFTRTINTVTPSVTAYAEAHRLSAAITEHIARTGHQPSSAELYVLAEIDPDAENANQKLLERLKEMERIINLGSPISLSHPSVVSLVETQETQPSSLTTVQRLMDKAGLHAEDRLIILHHLGLEGSKSQTFEEMLTNNLLPKIKSISPYRSRFTRGIRMLKLYLTKTAQSEEDLSIRNLLREYTPD